jgi:AraC-like DNA-binding protein
MAFSRPEPLQRQLLAAGLATVLDTDDFGCWEAAVATTLGHHRSDLLGPSQPFAARFRLGQLGSFGILHLTGRGRVRLLREQRQGSVLWLPLRGMGQERINGGDWLAEPGTGLLVHPGDSLLGDTSEELEGLSILIPDTLAIRPAAAGTPLRAAGPLSQRVLASARQLAAAAAGRPAGAEHAADQFHQDLLRWSESQQQPAPRERITARRRRDMVEEARRWMGSRLPERFGLGELSAALQVSPRQLQYSFLEELGRSPMAEAKRLRLRRLRGLLLDPDEDSRSVAELMAASGLLASGATAADYRRWCGESPRSTRRLRQPGLPSTPNSTTRAITPPKTIKA